MDADQARRSAEIRRQRLMRKERTEPRQLAAADQALQDGDLRLACMIYVQLAVARPPSAVTQEAKQRIFELQQQARSELREVDATLADESSAASTIPGLKPVLSDRELAERVPKAFQAYDDLARKYADVPVVGEEIARHVVKQRSRPAYAGVLNETNAKALWELGQRYEEDDHQCCAYLIYEHAAELMPAPSARLARKRLAQMEEDPRIMASVETCRELQWCHETYLRAEQLAKTTPSRAQAMFEEIVRRAPKDSEVYREALKQIEEL